MYDIFFVDEKQKFTQKWLHFKQDYPFAKNVSSFRDAQQKSVTKFFWVVWADIDVCNDFNFSYTPDSGSQEYVHVFLNGKYHDGVCLVPKKNYISDHEIKTRFFIAKKKVDILASRPSITTPYDTVFISYNESTADKNYQRLLRKVPDAKRVHGVKGIHQAHIEAAKLANTDMFWVVDGDAEILDDFNFDYQVPKWQLNHVHVWRSINPVNGLVYGYGGVKLLPKKQTINMDTSKPDMTTGISDKFVAVKEISNITVFNTGEFETWKGAFRECCKLASKTIDRQKDEETNSRLKIWCTYAKPDVEFADYALKGAKAGAAYGTRYRNDPESLKKINDFDWLKEKFNGNI